jgi:hypothetical protein
MQDTHCNCLNKALLRMLQFSHQCSGLSVKKVHYPTITPTHYKFRPLGQIHLLRAPLNRLSGVEGHHECAVVEAMHVKAVCRIVDDELPVFDVNRSAPSLQASEFDRVVIWRPHLHDFIQIDEVHCFAVVPAEYKATRVLSGTTACISNNVRTTTHCRCQRRRDPPFDYSQNG